MFNYLLVNTPPGFILQSIYLCTQPMNSWSRAVKYLSKDIYASFFRLPKFGFGKLSESQCLSSSTTTETSCLTAKKVLLRSYNLKIESQNGVQKNLSQESQLLSETHSSTWSCTTWPACLSSLEPERCRGPSHCNRKFSPNAYTFCTW